MTLTAVHIRDWEADPHVLAIRLRLPDLGHDGPTYFRRLNHNPGESGDTWGWYCNETNGALPDQEDLAPLLNALVLTHSVLKMLALDYGIHEGSTP